MYDRLPLSVLAPIASDLLVPYPPSPTVRGQAFWTRDVRNRGRPGGKADARACRAILADREDPV